MSESTDKNKSKPKNKLIDEKSPYLLQHAHNPVNWFPWGEEAFSKAKKENKPVFLSIGYSTCHWCHVMENESFEDIEVAKLLNDGFVSIKVDREERPDIDDIYMTICQVMTGRGGWPLTIIMTGDKKPFFTTTYIPKKTRQGQVGMTDLLPQISEIWTADKSKVTEIAQGIARSVKETKSESSEKQLTETALIYAYEQLSQNFDKQHGGFSHAPKFPMASNLTFLLRYGQRTNSKKELGMVEKTLQSMHRGGIFDQLSFGFHRYSTDEKWLLPHFEKMLYDQALIAFVYIEAYQATGKSEYKKAIRQIFDYVLHDMTAPKGGFYSAEDADSEGEEGKFYLWTEQEIRNILEEKDAEMAIQYFHVFSDGNFSDEATGIKSGKNVLFPEESQKDFALKAKRAEADVSDQLENIRQQLFAHRSKRVKPLRDDKILTDWNGLMIAALAKGAAVLDEPAYLVPAEKAASFIGSHLTNEDGKLFHRWRDGQAAVPAFLDDYAFLCQGMIELYEATFTVSYLKKAIELTDQMIKNFWDNKDGGLYFASANSEDLITRQKKADDGATPSGNSIAMLNLLQLARMTGRTDYEEKADQISKAFSKEVSTVPVTFTQFLQAVDFSIGPASEVIIVGDLKSKDTKEMLKALRREFVPNKVIVFKPGYEKDPHISRLAPFTKDLVSIDNKATAYVCRDFECKMPTTDINKMLRLIKQDEINSKD